MSRYLERLKALKSEMLYHEQLTKPTKPPFDNNHDRRISENTSIPSTVNDHSPEPTALMTDKDELQKKGKSEWPPDTQALVGWFTKLEAPTEPFCLEPHLKVIDPEKFFSSLRMDIEAGPNSPRGNRSGALVQDLIALKKYYELQICYAPVPAINQKRD